MAAIKANKHILSFLFLALPMLYNAQTVGVVLSGGGAGGFAHIGVLRALEENNIPIDYITGTSAGAMIGAMYACGYPVHVIDSIARTEKFQIMATGGIEDRYIYNFKKDELDGSWIGFRFSGDSILSTSIPTNFITTTLMDFEMMALMSGPSANADYNFDSLFVPFRCVASDIANKESIIFESGELHVAVRASMTYPFYMKPIYVNGKLLFDGGLYNNFPADIMYNEFLPDVIIGSNVSSNNDPPTEDNVLSQIQNMIVHETDFTLKCNNGIIIQADPGDNIGTFEFEKVSQVIDVGYEAAMAKMDSIKLLIDRRVTQDELNLKRYRFMQGNPELQFDQMTIDGLNSKQANYVRKILTTKGPITTIESLKKPYFKLYLDDKIKWIYPHASFNSSTGNYSLNLDVKKEKEFLIQFGGNFSSTPINTGYIGLAFNYFDRIGLKVKANSYFGKFYGSTQAKVRIDLPIRLPFYVEPEFTMNRLDFFRSSATFFEDVKPSYIVQYDQFTGLNVGFPIYNKGKLKFDGRMVWVRDEYYQTEQFFSTDTTDQTYFTGYTLGASYSRNTLNKKQYASEGTNIQLKVRFFEGEEQTIPGSTAQVNKGDTLTNFHSWVEATAQYDNYFLRRSFLKVGIHLKGVFTNKPFFQNYTATIIAAPNFSAIPESKTKFLPRFRAHTYIAGGMTLLIELAKNFEFRTQAHLFVPGNRISPDGNGKAYYETELSDKWLMASGGFVYHTPLGPVSISANYYDADEQFSFLFHFGYILFNNRYND